MKKKLLYIAALTGGLFLTTSCEDFLDTESLSNDNLEYLCSNPTDARKMIDHIYSLFCEDAYTSRMSNNWMQNTDVEFAPVSKSQAEAHSDRRGLWCLNPGEYSDLKSCWNNNSLAIDFANQCIEGIEASKMYKEGDADMAQLLGEAYCLRAYRYWLFCNFWGDVPFSTESTKYGQDFNLPRTDKNIIYSHLIQDLINIEEKMQWAEKIANGTERMNREFALGFIAKLSLFRAGYSMQADGTMKRCQIDSEITPVTYTDINGAQQTAQTSDDFYKVAKNYCEKLINLKDRALPTDFAKIFKDQINGASNANDDVLFEMGFTKGGGGDVAWCIGANVYGGSAGAGKTYTYLSPKYAVSFDSQDQRLNVTCEPYHWTTGKLQEAESVFGIAPSKWNRLELNSPSADKNTGVNWPVLRYPDVLLMLAEADMEINQGVTDLSKQMIKRVRERAFVNASNKDEMVDGYLNKISTYDQMKQAIMDERAWEFGGECIRKFDLIRWNEYSNQIVNTMEWCVKVGLNSQQLKVTSTELLYDKNQVVEDLGIASCMYYTYKDGMIQYLNKMNEYVPDTTYPTAETTSADSDAGLLKDGYTTDKIYKIDFAKKFFSVSKEDANKNPHGQDENGDDIKKGTILESLVYNFYGLTEDALLSTMDLSAYRNKVTPYVIPIPKDQLMNSNGQLSNEGYAIRNK